MRGKRSDWIVKTDRTLNTVAYWLLRSCAMIVTLAFLWVWAAVSASAETVTVDLSVDQGAVTYRAAGFDTGHGSAPIANTNIVPLNLTMWRCFSCDSSNAYLSQMPAGATAQQAMFGCYGDWPPTGGGCAELYNGDLTTFTNEVISGINGVLANPIPFQLDIFNEPNNNLSTSQFNPGWKIGVQQARSLAPGRQIIGPSIFLYDSNWIKTFLLYARDNNVLPDILSWHEYTFPSYLLSDVADIRAFMAANGIPNLPISINEAVTSNYTYLPGAYVWWYAAAERAGVASMGKGCWAEAYSDTCYGPSIDGLLDPTGVTKRSTWWATKGYGDLTGRMVQLTPGTATDGLAAKDVAAGRVRMVLGQFNGPGGSTVSVVVTHISQVFSGSSVHVHAEQIPYNGNYGTLAAPTVVLDQDMTVSTDTLTVSLPNFGGWDAYTVQISGSTGATTPPVPPQGLRVQ